jgi:hypothetical protein
VSALAASDLFSDARGRPSPSSASTFVARALQGEPDPLFWGPCLAPRGPGGSVSLLQANLPAGRSGIRQLLDCSPIRHEPETPPPNARADPRVLRLGARHAAGMNALRGLTTFTTRFRARHRPQQNWRPWVRGRSRLSDVPKSLPIRRPARRRVIRPTSAWPPGAGGRSSPVSLRAPEAGLRARDGRYSNEADFDQLDCPPTSALPERGAVLERRRADRSGGLRPRRRHGHRWTNSLRTHRGSGRWA